MATIETPEGEYTVRHYNRTTGRWHVEEKLDARGEVWTTDKATAYFMADTLSGHGFAVAVVKASELAGVENLPFNGSLVEIQV